MIPGTTSCRDGQLILEGAKPVLRILATHSRVQEAFYIRNIDGFAIGKDCCGLGTRHDCDVVLGEDAAGRCGIVEEYGREE